MRSPFPLRYVFAAALAFLVVPVGASAKDDWVRVRSENFELIGDAPEKEVRRVATKMEQFREVFKRLFPKLQFVSPVPTTVIVFKSEKSFTPYKPVNASGKTTKWIAGYFQPGESSNYILLSTERESNQTYTTIFHEYIHLLVNNSFGRSRIPPWFNEGIAEYYEQFGIEEDQKVQLGNLNESHLVSLQRSKLIPFETYFHIDYYSLHQQGDHGANIFYAQSWAFVHYLIHANKGARRGQLDVFLSSVLAGVPPSEAFEKAFHTDYVTMEKELKRYVEQRQFSGTLVTLKDKLNYDSVMRAEPVAEAEAKSKLGELLLNTGRLAEAERHLNESLAADPSSTFAQGTLAMVRMRQKRFPEAKQLLENSLKKENSNYLAYYRYAYLLSREAVDDNNMYSSFPDESAAKMREALRKAIKLNPNFPESYSLLAFISLVRNDEVDDAILQVQTALKLSPGNQDYILHLASLYARKEEFDKAQSLAETVYRTSEESQTRARAQSILSNIASFREFAEMKKNPGAAVRQGSDRFTRMSEDKPPSEEELAKLREEAKQRSMNEALRTTKPGEKRVLGQLSKIECGRAAIIYSIKQAGGMLRLRTTDFQSLELTAFVPTGDTPVSCDGLAKEYLALLTYIPGEDPKTKTSGELVAIELVPDDFRLIEN